MLADRLIRRAISGGRIKIVPFVDANLQPVSYDIHVGETAKVFKPELGRSRYSEFGKQSVLDLQTGRVDMLEVDVPRRQDPYTLVIQPREFMLVATEEHLELSDSIAAKVDGKSTIGRVGLFVHVTAGLIDPGWRGKITLELYNVSFRPIRLWRGMPIGQFEFYDLGQSVDRPYGSAELGSHYQDAREVESAKSFNADQSGFVDPTVEA